MIFFSLERWGVAEPSRPDPSRGTCPPGGSHVFFFFTVDRQGVAEPSVEKEPERELSTRVSFFFALLEWRGSSGRAGRWRACLYVEHWGDELSRTALDALFCSTRLPNPLFFLADLIEPVRSKRRDRVRGWGAEPRVAECGGRSKGSQPPRRSGERRAQGAGGKGDSILPPNKLFNVQSLSW